MQFPEGQSSASWAVHSAAQLVPFPQVTLTTSFVSRKQHVTVEMFSALENASSKATIEVDVVVSPLGTIVTGVVGLGLSTPLIISHSFNDIVVVTCDKMVKHLLTS